MSEPVHNAERLAELQALPLERKIQISQARIIEWYQHYNGNVVVSFSGGKDSTVLLHLVRTVYPNVKAVFSNTGLEYPEIQRFVKSFPNVDVVAPTMRFDQVISLYGYPIISKEVAEAIYYARRISSQNVQVERERERARERKRAELHGEREQKRAEPPQGSDRNCTNHHKKESIHPDGNFWVQENVPSGETGVECGIGRIGVAEYSMFNKQKYLPLARDVPILISHMCCGKMKKAPLHKYEKKTKTYPILGTLADESRIRKQAWLRHGCNAFKGNYPTSQPMSFWTEQDVLQYIIRYNLDIAPVYGDVVAVDESGNEYNARELIVPCKKLQCSGCDRTGCVYCGFGFHNERGTTRFQRLAQTHPRQYEYCIGGGKWVDNPYYDPTAPEYDGEWKNWNPKKIWSVSEKGLGLGKVFDMVNEIYGKDFYRYE